MEKNTMELIRKYWSFILLLFVLILAIAVSLNIGAQASLSSDFNVFWQAGRNFNDHLSLYSNIGGARRYIYPPFASMCFQLFSVFSLHQAAVLFSICNWFFWGLIIFYTWTILKLTTASDKQIKLSLAVSFLLSFRYFWYHLAFIQVNELILLLSLAGIYYFLIKREGHGIALLVIATFIKIIPVLILIWVLSKGNFKRYLQAFVCCLVCVLLPVLFRGFHQGINDILDYYTTFLQPFKEGRIEPELQNYGLAAALYKLFSYTADGEKYHYLLKSLSPAAIQLIYAVLMVFSVLSFILILVYSRHIRKKISILELGFTFMFTHLLSGITWEYHLVTFYFVIPIVLLNFQNAKNGHRWFCLFMLIVLFFNAVVGSDTVGFDFYYKCCGYSLLTWTMLLLQGYFLFVYFFGERQKLEFNQYSS